MSDAIDQLAGKFSDIVTALQGPGLEIAKAAARTEALSSLVADALATMIGAGLTYVAWRCFKKDPELDRISTFGALLGGCLGAIFLIGGVICLFDPWIYVTMAHPEQWLAKKALKF